MGRKTRPSAREIANLRPIRSSERAKELSALGMKKRLENKDRKKLLLDDIREVVTAEIAVPKALYDSLKELNVPIQRKDTIDKVVFYRALLRAIKEGNADQLLKIAEFAGMKFTEEETPASTMTPDTELMLSTLFAQGRKVEPPKQPEAVNGADGAAKTEGASGTHADEPSITVFSGLG